jgi:hypothetical protein
MIRESYDRWNSDQDGRNVGVNEFIAFTYRNSEDHLEGSAYALPGNWITNWFRQFDFSCGPYAHLADATMYAARLDTKLAPQLGVLPERLRDGPLTHPRSTGEFNLASETMKRSFTLNIASAQEAIAIVNDRLAGGPAPQIKLLTRGELVADEAPAVRQAFDTYEVLRRQTPLWYYVLKEAQVRESGNRLGPFGARVVMETLHAAIEASEHSILATNNWRPSLPGHSGCAFAMPDLIAFSSNPDVRGLLAKAT